MPLPYGPESTADKPSAKAHPSSQGARSLVIRTEAAAAGAGKGEENGKVELVLEEEEVGWWGDGGVGWRGGNGMGLGMRLGI